MKRQKMLFHIEQDEDGYPPFAVETVWVDGTDAEDCYVVANIPFFARQATLGDVVCAFKNRENLVFDHILVRSTNSLFRVIVFSPDEFVRCMGQLQRLGCHVEGFRSKQILGASIPADVRLSDVQAYLEPLERQGLLTYEEAILRH